MAKLRLRLFIDYEADPKYYDTDDPKQMALIDSRIGEDESIRIHELNDLITVFLSSGRYDHLEWYVEAHPDEQ